MSLECSVHISVESEHPGEMRPWSHSYPQEDESQLINAFSFLFPERETGEERD